jgi:hypothetical protein
VTDVVPPVQARLFAVEPADGTRLQVVIGAGRVIVATGDLAAAVIAAASVAAGAWVVGIVWDRSATRLRVHVDAQNTS